MGLLIFREMMKARTRAMATMMAVTHRSWMRSVCTVASTGVIKAPSRMSVSLFSPASRV